VYAARDAIGDQVMAAVVLQEDATLTPEELEAFLAEQPDLSPKAWPRYVRIAEDLPSTATNKVLKRELVAQGAVADEGEQLWVRDERGTAYAPAEVSSQAG
jgi:fatty-acyl-CoA synthase